MTCSGIWCPQAARLAEASAAYRSALYPALDDLDAEASDPSREKRLSLLLAHYLKPYLETRPESFADTPDAYREAVHESRLFLSPLNPPRVELEAAVLVLFKKRGLSPLQRPRRSPAGRGGGAERGPERPAERDAGWAGQDDAETRDEAETQRPRRRRRRRPASGNSGGSGAAGRQGPAAPLAAATPRGRLLNLAIRSRRAG